jgi:tetratricopeptide (TPR) repeat protein
MQALALVWLPWGRDTSCTPAPVNSTEGRALYTPQRLFGEVGSPSDVLTHEPFLERARLQREQERDASARLALGAYIVARLVDRLLSFETDEEAAEGFRWQLESVRRHVDELPSDEPETAHLAGVVAAIPLERYPLPSLWKSLTAYAYFLENEGRLEESLEMLMLAARVQGSRISPADFASYALSAGRLNRELARWEIATTCYHAAEDAGQETGDLTIVLRSRLGLGAVHRGQGNYPLARAAADDVVSRAAVLGLPDVQAMAYADLGVIYSLQGLKLEALESHYKAFQLSTDVLQQMRTLSDLAMGLSEGGAYDAARLAFQIVINSGTKLLVRVNAMLELMDLESTVGNRVSFERCRAAAEKHSARMPPSMRVDYHYKIGMGLARFGQLSRARASLSEALAAAEQHRLNAWYFKVEQALTDLAERRNEEQNQKSELSAAPVVREMEVGLREYASAMVG